ncbi:hypothetical protein ACNTMW_05260 [Planosporangium sp. 12N6]|uniref:hypothetical protein n=1 Tax=Planosporangium spinosum TaxID=3402278 RepID=UPI003CE984A7
MAALLVLAAVLAATWPDTDDRSVLDPPRPTAVAASGGLFVPLPPAGQEPPLAAGTAAPPVSDGTVTPPPASPASPGPGGGASASARPARFTAVAGESCPQSDASGFFAKGRARDWYDRASGGWTGDGCAGRMIAVPMSGDPKVDDPDNVIVWRFRVSGGASCAVQAHVPATGRALDAAGAPATYFVYATDDATGAPIGRFDVDQMRNQGRWVPAGSYASGTGRLSVRMVTRGIDFGPGRDGAHLGVSALRVTC